MCLGRCTRSACLAATDETGRHARLSCQARLETYVQRSSWAFWDSLSVQQRKELLSVDKRELFQTIRAKYCSRCFGLFHLRWDELKSAPSDNPCPACSEYFCSLQVQPDGHTLTLEDSIVQRQPFTTFAEAKRRERERLLQYAGTGVLICGNEWTRSPGNSMCNLHTSNVSRPASDMPFPLSRA